MLTVQTLIAVLSCQASSGTLWTPSQSNLSNQNITKSQPSWHHFPFRYTVLTTEMLSRVTVWMLSCTCIDLNNVDLLLWCYTAQLFFQAVTQAAPCLNMRPVVWETSFAFNDTTLALVSVPEHTVVNMIYLFQMQWLLCHELNPYLWLLWQGWVRILRNSCCFLRGSQILPWTHISSASPGRVL